MCAPPTCRWGERLKSKGWSRELGRESDSFQPFNTPTLIHLGDQMQTTKRVTTFSRSRNVIAWRKFLAKIRSKASKESQRKAGHAVWAGSGHLVSFPFQGKWWWWGGEVVLICTSSKNWSSPHCQWSSAVSWKKSQRSDKERVNSPNWISPVLVGSSLNWRALSGSNPGAQLKVSFTHWWYYSLRRPLLPRGLQLESLRLTLEMRRVRWPFDNMRSARPAYFRELVTKSALTSLQESSPSVLWCFCSSGAEEKKPKPKPTPPP